jgi:purine-binding chemotaxis protein CheW
MTLLKAEVTADSIALVTAALGPCRLAFLLGQVVRIVRAAHVMPLPAAPQGVLGLLDIAGRAVPVVSARLRLGLSDRAVGVDDQYVILESGESPASRQLAVVVDAVQGLAHCRAADLQACDGAALQGVPVDGLVALPDGLALITDIQRFLFPEEALAPIDAGAATAPGAPANAAAEVP